MINQQASHYSFIVIILVAAFLELTPARALAQDLSAGVAHQLNVATNHPSGTLICLEENIYTACSKAYASEVYGIVNDFPPAAIQSTASDSAVLVQTTGIVTVRATEVNGDIREGDVLTTSEVEGVAQKATQNGYVIGAAVSDYAPIDNNTGTVQIALNMHIDSNVSAARSNLLNVVLNGFDQSLFAPIQYLQYALAAGLTLMSFVIGTIYFGKNAGKGIEAMGRNPLARAEIQKNVLLSVIVTLIIVSFGLVASYIIILL